VTFSLTGFTPVKRDGITLTGTATAVVNAELRVGGVAETITVTGEAALVDVQSVATERSITRDLIDAVPTGRTLNTMAVLIPGMSTTTAAGLTAGTDVGGSALSGIQSSQIHGGNQNDQRMLMDGMPVTAATGNASGFMPNFGSIQEFTIDTSGGSAEDNAGGVRMNIIPREGGNVFHATVFGEGTGSSLQSANYSDELAARGMPTPNPLKTMKSVYTFNPSGGGAITKDKLWVYLAANRSVSQEYRLVYPNINGASSYVYAPDVNAGLAFQVLTLWSGNGRLTWQLNPKNKLSFYAENQSRCVCPTPVSGGTQLAPESQQLNYFPGQRLMSLTYSSPVTNKLLLDAAVLNRLEGWRRDQAGDRNAISVVDTTTGINYHGFLENSHNAGVNNNMRVALSMVTGAHAMKAGFTFQHSSQRAINETNPLGYDYRFANGVPTTLVEYADPRDVTTFSNDAGIFLQDRYTMKRLTLTGGIRWDYYRSYFPAITLGPTVVTPTRNVSFPDTDGVSWKDVTPRMGASYDVFGNGKTAVKVSLNKYLGFTGVTSSSRPFAGGLNPGNRVTASTTRSWTDTNKNFVPDCVISNTAANGECGAVSATFGQPVTSTNYDPAILDGYNKRDYNWEFTAGVQQQLTSRLSVDVGFFRRWFGNLKVTDNLSTAASDYNTFSIVAPSTDSRLPTAGQTISGFYNVSAAKFTAPTNNFVTMASNYGDWIQTWQGVDVNVTARAWSGITLQGGLSTGRAVNDNCAVLPLLPEIAVPPSGDTTNPAGSGVASGAIGANPFCRVESSYNAYTQIKGLGTYQIPKIDVRVSAAFQSIPGPVVGANYSVPNAAVVPSLGRSLSGNAATYLVNLVPPLTLNGDRLNQVDMRFSKIFRFGGRGRVAANLDLFNMFNRNPVITQNDGFSTTNTTTWQTPTAVQPGRLIKVGAQFDF
jgi:hypothetical protein